MFQLVRFFVDYTRGTAEKPSSRKIGLNLPFRIHAEELAFFWPTPTTASITFAVLSPIPSSPTDIENAKIRTRRRDIRTGQ